MWVIGSKKGTGLVEVGWEGRWGSRGGGGGEGREGVKRGFIGEGWSWGRRRDNIVWPGNRGTRGQKCLSKLGESVCFRICNPKRILEKVLSISSKLLAPLPGQLVPESRRGYLGSRRLEREENTKVNQVANNRNLWIFV